MPTVIVPSDAPQLRHPLESVQVSAASSPIFVLNTNALAATGDSALNPFAVLAATSTNHANVYIVPVPERTTVLSIWHEWVGTDPTTIPIVNVFGLVPRGNDSLDPLLRAWNVSNTFYNPTVESSPLASDRTGEWRRLKSLSENLWSLSLADATCPIALNNGTSKHGAARFVNLQGCTYVMALVATAGSGPTTGVINGCFTS